MNATSLKDLLTAVQKRKVTPDEALERLRHMPFEDLGFAKVDHHRALRHGMPPAGGLGVGFSVQLLCEHPL